MIKITRKFAWKYTCARKPKKRRSKYAIYRL